MRASLNKPRRHLPASAFVAPALAALLLLAGSWTCSAGESYAPFRADLTAGAAYSLDARKLHPTQFALGWREVVSKQKVFDEKTPAEREAYLREKDVPVVIGPGGIAYLTDGHHTLRALLESTTPDKTAFGHILANWSDLAPAKFWQEMQAHNYAYLHDARGRGPQPPESLPETLLLMQRDPYRGLAWGVMKAGGFAEKKGVFFQEFRWADFFRDQIAWNDDDDAAFARAVRDACVLAHAPEAAQLPGYLPAAPRVQTADGLAAPAADAIQPRVISAPTAHDTDDPAIWINPADAAQSLIIGTDKDSDGALYVYDLAGRIVQIVSGLKRPNNVDVVSGLTLGGRAVDVAVVTERELQRLRVFRLPDMDALDRGDLVVFEGDRARAPMGVALYRRPQDGAVFAFVSGKSGPARGYIGQYRLEDDGAGNVRMKFVRQFGAFSGSKEIEAIAVDAELGYVYYADESVGVRKYRADPDAPDADQELALFATSGFAGDREGISIYKRDDGTGYILVSDQQADRFWMFRREGEPGRPHEHRLVRLVDVAAIESDGSEVTSAALGEKFPRGLFVAMSNGRVFHFYAWDDLAGDEPATAVTAADTIR